MAETNAPLPHDYRLLSLQDADSLKHIGPLRQTNPLEELPRKLLQSILESIDSNCRCAACRVKIPNALDPLSNFDPAFVISPAPSFPRHPKSP